MILDKLLVDVVELGLLFAQGLQLLLLNLDLLVLVGELLLLLLVRDLVVLVLKLLTAVFLLLRVEGLNQRCVVSLLLLQVGVQTVSSVLSSLFLLGKGLDLLVLLGELLLHGLLLLHKLLDSIVLVELEARSELNGLVELGDLSSQLADDLAGLFFLFLGGLDQFPSFVDLFLEQADC